MMGEVSLQNSSQKNIHNLLAINSTWPINLLLLRHPIYQSKLQACFSLIHSICFPNNEVKLLRRIKKRGKGKWNLKCIMATSTAVQIQFWQNQNRNMWLMILIAPQKLVALWSLGGGGVAGTLFCSAQHDAECIISKILQIHGVKDIGVLKFLLQNQLEFSKITCIIEYQTVKSSAQLEHLFR